MRIRRLIRDRAPLHIVRGSRSTCEVCGHVGHTYSSTRYGEATDHCFRCHSHRRKRNLAAEVNSRMSRFGPGGRLLEIAPGGQLSEMLRRRYRGYIGLRYPPYSATSLPIASESIDMVVSCDVIEHFRFPALAMSEIHRVLRPLGVHVSAVLTEGPKTQYGDGAVLGFHMDEDGGKCPVYTALGEDLAHVAAEWAGDSSATWLRDGMLLVQKVAHTRRVKAHD